MAKRKQTSRPAEKLFADDQMNMFEKSYEERLQEEKNKLVECFGMSFENDEERRKYFLEKLREKLKEPEFRKIEGFPIGEDEDVLALSDPPYYTACPNPFIEDFIAHYGKPYDPNVPYSKEPFASDVSEGKNDPIYNAHSYHTKVPHKAIMRYILHYTEPGDVVFDGFCGTGMTGVAAQMCGDRATVESLGYQVKPDGTILRQETDENRKSVWVVFSKLGPRRAVLNDLSPAATFIAYNYNTPVDVPAFEREAKRILKEFEKKTKWMWETIHSDGKTAGKINYVVWSDVYSCAECAGEFVYYDHAFVKKGRKVEFTPEFYCPHCQSLISKSPSKNSAAQKPDRVWNTEFDSLINTALKKTRQVPVIINYSIGTKRHEKRVDSKDLAVIKKVIGLNFDAQFIPVAELEEGDKAGDPFGAGVKFVHQFYTHRILQALSQFVQQADNSPQFLFLLGSALPKLTIMNRYMPQHGGRALVGPMANTLYVPPVSVENNVIDQLCFQFKKIAKALNSLKGSLISTQAAQQIHVPDNSADYIFLDPPFGANIMYSELNFIREAWLKIFTNSEPEAIENKTQKKTIDGYRVLMTECFKETYRILKPGRWMTVEFSNTKSSVWNSIQNALSEAGFIVASVAALDKTRGGLHAMIGPTAVKQDLVISAYKPNGGFEERFLNEVSTEEGVWDFIRSHLKYLPVIKKQDGVLVSVSERDPRILFDKMVAYYIRKGYLVPISSQEFQLGLVQRFPERDGMYFLPDQAAEYDKKRMTVKEVLQLQLFVSDEASAIQWLKQQLTRKPQAFQDINPLFMKEIGGWQKHEKALELFELLEQNFLRYDGKGEVPSQIHSYLSSNFKELRKLAKDDPALKAKSKDRWYVPDPNKASDLEKLRERTLLREFEEYRESKQKRLKVFRLEAVRAGFKKAWQERDYATIITVASKIPKKILQEDPKLLMWYDQAVTRTGGDQ
jgi:DNA modification methylase